MPVPTKPRSDPFDMAPAPIEPELRAQLEQRNHRRRQSASTPRVKATYDIPAPLQLAVEEIAAAEQIGLSDVVRLAILRLVDDRRAGRLPDLTPMKRPSRSPKSWYTLELDAGKKG